MELEEYIKSEVERQYSTQFDEFAGAIHVAKLYRTDEVWTPERLAMFCCNLATLVDPANEMRVLPNTLTNLRTSHVGFRDGGSACPAGEVVERFERHMEFGIGVIEHVERVRTHPDHFEGDDAISVVDSWIKGLLDIHPWQDANGRTASILRNWLLGTLDNPTPLPYFYGQS